MMRLIAELVRQRMVCRRRPGHRLAPQFESLEGRRLLATYTVSNLLDSGDGSLRAALLDANKAPGADEIVFTVAGDILLRSPLPTVTDPVTIDGTSAPGYSGTPVVTIDFANRTGLRFGNGSDGSALGALAITKARGPGVTLDGSGITLAGNYIGIEADGTTVAGNTGDGVRINAASSGNIIGDVDPVRGIDYFNATAVSTPVSTWAGIRGLDDGQYLMTGSSGTSGLLYVGPLSGAAQGQAFTLNYPGAESTSVYGPDDLGDGNVLLVGTYVMPGDSTRYGFSFRGNVATMATDVTDAANYTQIWNGSPFNYVHSAMGGLAVGNFITSSTNIAAQAGRAFIYDLDSGLFIEDIVFPGSLSNTAYGIWDNGDGTYTIAGGYSQRAVNNVNDRLQPIGMGSLVDYDRATGRFSNWRSFSYRGGPNDTVAGTHFMGISGIERGVYQLSGSAFDSGTFVTSGWATVRRQADGTFGAMDWVDLAVPESVTGFTGITSANSVYGDAVVGIVSGGGSVASYQARLDIGFERSNVISGNRGNGIAIYGGSDNRIAMNHIGTTAAGTAAAPNRRHGVFVTLAASGNVIGGEATGGNDPVGSPAVFVRPPQGNLISGNSGSGVVIGGRATGTSLSGNFIGTRADGLGPLGNAYDGVAILNAHGNRLVGTTSRQDPFQFYNVISGNGRHGLRITNADDTVVQGNFFGIGATNASVVANDGNGILVNGRSRNTLVGGPAPLGNVTSGNKGHGIEVQGSVSGFTASDTFAGQFARGAAAPNEGDGIRITSIGGNNVVRGSVVGGNRGNGITLTGLARDVRITDTGVGTNAARSAALPNGGSGIVVSGRANNNAIGGFQPTTEPQVILSGNGRYGLEIINAAFANTVSNTVVGADGAAGNATAIPNSLGGIFLGSGTSRTTIGGAQPGMATTIRFNQGPGITIQRASLTTVLGSWIEANTGGGIVASSARNTAIGAVGAGNTISGNQTSGILVDGRSSGTEIVANTIQSNTENGVLLVGATDLLVGGDTLGVANTIAANTGYGLYAVGTCSRTRVIRNAIVTNTAGNVSLGGSTGIIYVA
jgi:hypothetical protein